MPARSSIIVLLSFLCGAGLWAQQDPQFSMYMFNRTVVNAASVGHRGATNITAVGRTQWVGIPGHPNTFTLSADAAINAIHGGVGGYFMYDQVGPISTLGLKAAYAYRFNFGKDRGTGPGLQIGIMPGFFQKQIDGTNFRPGQLGDATLDGLVGVVESAFVFDLGAGIWFDLPDDKLFLGVAADHLLEPKISVANLEETNVPRTFNFIGGYRIGRTGAKVTVTPSTYVRLAGTQLQVDANVNVNVNPLVFGLSYRFLDANEVVGIVGFNANQRLFVAYSYDYTFSALQNSTSGSHEIVLSYTFPQFIKFYPPDLDTMDNPALR